MGVFYDIFSYLASFPRKMPLEMLKIALGLQERCLGGLLAPLGIKYHFFQIKIQDGFILRHFFLPCLLPWENALGNLGNYTRVPEKGSYMQIIILGHKITLIENLIFGRVCFMSFFPNLPHSLGKCPGKFWKLHQGA